MNKTRRRKQRERRKFLRFQRLAALYSSVRGIKIKSYYEEKDRLGLPRIIQSVKDLGEVLFAVTNLEYNIVFRDDGHIEIRVAPDCIDIVKQVLYDKMPAYHSYSVGPSL